MPAPQFIEWSRDEGYKVRRMRWGGFVYEERGGGAGFNQSRRTFERVEGEWPDDDTLITLADGDDPDHPRHFGGFVKDGDGLYVKHITVYTD